MQHSIYFTVDKMSLLLSSFLSYISISLLGQSPYFTEGLVWAYGKIRGLMGSNSSRRGQNLKKALLELHLVDVQNMFKKSCTG